MLRMLAETGRGLFSVMTPAEQGHQVERNKRYMPAELLARLERATTGNYTGYYDIDCHDKAMIISSEPLFAATTNMWVPYLTTGTIRLTLEDGTFIEAKENDWLVPLVIRKEGFENIHLLLPSSLIGDCKAGDTLKLKYREQVFTITIANDDPQYHDYQNGRYRGEFDKLAMLTEHQLYKETGIPKPSVMRKRADMESHLSEVPGLIRTINENQNTFCLDLTNKSFVPLKSQQPLSLGVNSKVEIRGPHIHSENDAQPVINANGFGLYCGLTGISSLIMSVTQDKLIFWRTETVDETDTTIPKELLARLKTDVFTVFPLNENTISAQTILANVNKMQFKDNVGLGLKV